MRKHIKNLLDYTDDNKISTPSVVYTEKDLVYVNIPFDNNCTYNQENSNEFTIYDKANNIIYSKHLDSYIGGNTVGRPTTQFNPNKLDNILKESYICTYKDSHKEYINYKDVEHINLTNLVSVEFPEYAYNHLESQFGFDNSDIKNEIYIQSNFFGYCPTLESITLHNNVISIKDNAFANCPNLKEITYISDEEHWNEIDIQSGWYNGTKIRYVFISEDNNIVYLSKPTTNFVITLSNGNIEYVDSIDDYKFDIVSLEITEKVKNIPEYFFNFTGVEEKCKLKKVFICDGVETIGDSAFKGCTTLEFINLPDSIEYIGISCFNGCTSLKQIKLPYNLTTIKQNTFTGCKNLESVEISKSVINIEKYAFRNAGLKSIHIPANVETIGNYAFWNNTDLLSITFDKNSKLTELNDYTFRACISLKSINIPSNITSIGKYCFFGCDAVSDINLESGLNSIGSYAFSECNHVKKIVIPDSVNYIGNRAFTKCDILEIINIFGKDCRWDDDLYEICGNNPDIYKGLELSLPKSNTMILMTSTSSIHDDFTGQNFTTSPTIYTTGNSLNLLRCFDKRYNISVDKSNIYSDVYNAFEVFKIDDYGYGISYYIGHNNWNGGTSSSNKNLGLVKLIKGEMIEHSFDFKSGVDENNIEFLDGLYVNKMIRIPSSGCTYKNSIELYPYNYTSNYLSDEFYFKNFTYFDKKHGRFRDKSSYISLKNKCPYVKDMISIISNDGDYTDSSILEINGKKGQDNLSQEFSISFNKNRLDTYREFYMNSDQILIHFVQEYESNYRIYYKENYSDNSKNKSKISDTYNFTNENGYHKYNYLFMISNSEIVESKRFNKELKSQEFICIPKSFKIESGKENLNVIQENYKWGDKLYNIYKSNLECTITLYKIK